MSEPHAAWADFAAGDRVCSFCGYPCLPEDHPATSKDGGHYAHFTCWYDNDAFPPMRYRRDFELPSDIDAVDYESALRKKEAMLGLVLPFLNEPLDAETVWARWREQARRRPTAAFDMVQLLNEEWRLNERAYE